MTTIDTLHAEIEALHQESMARLNRMAWQVKDLQQLCEALATEITRRTTPGDLRAKRARTVLQGAADDTSRRIALRLCVPWYSEELQAALERVNQPQEQHEQV